ncbi:MAG: hypothetical protein NC548_47495 [Lachnospiraceae bacterium]|nr:hypothetical protein [Lachnospiraceae bacterium]
MFRGFRDVKEKFQTANQNNNQSMFTSELPYDSGMSMFESELPDDSGSSLMFKSELPDD